MKLQSLATIPIWADRLAWSTVILLAVSLCGRFLSRRMCQRLGAWAATTKWRWDDLIMPVTSLTEYLVRLFVILFGGLMILHGLGVSIVPLLTALGVGGLAVA